jgi:hypothetical protein
MGGPAAGEAAGHVDGIAATVRAFARPPPEFTKPTPPVADYLAPDGWNYRGKRCGFTLVSQTLAGCVLWCE